MSKKIEHSVNKFAGMVLRRLMMRLGDKGDAWGDVHPLWVIAKLTEELGEVASGVNHSFDGTGRLTPGREQHLIEAISECYDVGAMAMILAETLSDALAGDQ